MGVPDYQFLMLPLLRALADGDEHDVADVRGRLATELKLTEADRSELLPSGKQAVFDNRVGWAKTYLDKAGLLTSPRRGVYRVTDLGRSLLGERPERIDRQVLLRFEPFRDFVRREPNAPDASLDDGALAPPIGPARTPEEALESAYRQIRHRLEAELLEAVSKASPTFFERLVVDLLVKMGYGGSVEDAGKSLGRSHDDGLDGVIKEDHLGLDAIYVQAKRWMRTVGRPEIQAFAGSLEGARARKGVFITISTFSGEAREYVARIEKKIALIDGAQLAALMVDFGIGVNTVSSYELKRVDSDYFSEE